VSAYIEKKDKNRLMRIYQSASINSIDFSGMRPGVVVFIDANLDCDRDRMRSIFELLLRNKVYEICSVGNFAEDLHDYFDNNIEITGSLDIVTTACIDNVEGVEYFMYGAGAAERDLLALIDDNPYLLEILAREFENFQNI
jgi:hypothetical protein